MSCQQNGLREAELTDWKDNRYFRLMAVDHGVLSWTDVQHQSDGSHWPLTLVTWPPGADTRAGDREPLYRLASSSHIRLLVFSPRRVVRVTVSLDTGEQVECNTETGALWTGAWSPGGMGDKGRTRVMEVRVEDAWGARDVSRHEYTLEAGEAVWPELGPGRLILLLDMIAFFQVKKHFEFRCKNRETANISYQNSFFLI